MYNKIFTKILDSSIWLAPDPHRLVWITLIAAMDEDGNVMFACADNVAARARVTVEQAESALAAFEAPDLKSGDPDNEGRRIERFPGGWHVLNAHKYRAMVTKAIIREQTRVRTANYRAKERSVTHSDATVTQSIETVTTSRAEALAPSRAASDSGKAPAPTALSGKPARKRADKPAGGGVLAWGGYSSAYEKRYGVEPVRNASVNAKLALFAGKIGEAEAADVARFYVGHQNRLYVGAMHPVDLLLRDAERLRTEWATGRTVTSTQATQADKTQTNANVFGPMIEQARREEADAKR